MSGASNVTAVKGNVDPSEQGMLDEVVERQNMRAAYRQVKRVEIPKPGGGVRRPGIPTVVDRLIRQALHQVMSVRPARRSRSA